MSEVFAQTVKGQLRLSLRDVSKHFGGVQALAGVSLAVRPGEVFGLLGENGSGKSTLVKILSGFYTPDTGSLEYDGAAVRLPIDGLTASSLGMAFVHQELGLVSSLSALENYCLPDIARSRQLHFSWKTMKRRAERELAEFGVAYPLDTLVSNLSSFDRALLAIARAVNQVHNAGRSADRTLVLDEAMAFLARDERLHLLRLLRTLTREGAAVIMVTHDLDDALGMCDRCAVLRDGHLVGVFDTKVSAREQLISAIVGAISARVDRPDQDAGPFGRDADGIGRVAFRVSGMRCGGLRDVSFSVNYGEIVGVTGLSREPYREVVRGIFGAIPSAAGTLEFRGVTYPLTAMSPSSALALGLVLIPGDRPVDGVIGTLSVEENVGLPLLGRYFRRCALRTRQWLLAVDAALRRANVRGWNGRGSLIAELSGGNQQKAVIAKWLTTSGEVWLLDEPTLGVDVGARREIQDQLVRLARSGSAILYASNEVEDLCEVCDRVLVVRHGRVMGEVARADLQKEQLLAIMLAA